MYGQYLRCLISSNTRQKSTFDQDQIEHLNSESNIQTPLQYNEHINKSCIKVTTHQPLLTQTVKNLGLPKVDLLNSAFEGKPHFKFEKRWKSPDTIPLQNISIKVKFRVERMDTKQVSSLLCALTVSYEENRHNKGSRRLAYRRNPLPVLYKSL